MKLRKGQARAILGRILVGPQKPWTGPVMRRDPGKYQRRSIILPWRCRGIGCGHWTPLGSRAAGMCLICFTPKPDDVE